MAFRRMRKVEEAEYRAFIERNSYVRIGKNRIRLNTIPPETFSPPEFRPEEWTLWSFPERGEWATHHSAYRGNWSPYIPRNLIEKYTKHGDTVLDQMMGSGTTLVECRLTGRNGIGVDINRETVMLAMNKLDFSLPDDLQKTEGRVELFIGDARNLDMIEDSSIDLIATHPPYCGIIKYSSSGKKGDLSQLKLPEFMEAMKGVASEAFRVLRENRYCAVLIGDTRNRRHYVPISVGVLSVFLEEGFVLKEEIIKVQHRTRSSRERWKMRSYDFFKIGHEHLFIFRKPACGEDGEFKLSRKWW